MSEENTNTNAAGTAERAGFCQDCGKPLTRDTIRTVGSGVFCEPCLAVRIGAGTPASAPVAGSAYATGSWDPVRTGPPPGYRQAGYTPQPGYTPQAGYTPISGSYPPPPGGFTPAPLTQLPNPTTAGFLGIIPGVGAMYNGQFAKGLIHFVIFAMLEVLQNSVSSMFGLFVLVWEVYQIFDAYQTAVARRAGLPLPNLLGINELAERLGLGNLGLTPQPGGNPAPGPVVPPPGAPNPSDPLNPYAASSPSATAGPDLSGSSPSTPYPPASAAPPAAVPVYGPAYSSYGVPPANWAGYVHPSHIAPPQTGAPAPAYGVPPAPAYAPTASAPPLSGPPPANAAYGDTFAGPAVAASAAVPPVTARRFPLGAIWLIAAGILVLVGNLSSEWRISGQWVLAGLCATLAVWTLARRLEWAGGTAAMLDGEWPRLACMLRAPVMLLTLAVLLALQAAHVATFGQTWPVFPIIFGVLLVLERTVGAGPLPPVAAVPLSPAMPIAAYPAVPAPADSQAPDVQP